MDQDSEMSEDEKSVSERKRRMKKKIPYRKMCEIWNEKEIVKKLETTMEKEKKDAD